MEILAKAQMEINAIIAERRVRTALTRDIPPEVDHVYKLRDEVLVFSEKEKNWVGPQLMVNTMGRMTTVQTKEGDRRKTFGAFQIKPFFKEIEERITYMRQLEVGEPQPHEELITEEIKPNDPLAWKFDDAKKKELEVLIKRGTWEIVCRDDVGDNAHILGGRFLLAIKDDGTEKKFGKQDSYLKAIKIV